MGIKGKISKLLTKEQTRVLYLIVSSGFTACVMIFSLFALQSVMQALESNFKIFFSLTFLFLSFSRIPLALSSIRTNPVLLKIIKNFVFSFIYLAIAIFVFLFPPIAIYICPLCFIYFLTILANRVCICIENPKVVSIIFNSILAFLAFSASIVCITVATQEMFFVPVITMATIVIMFVSLFETLVFAFSKMKVKGILKIIRKTYAFEVLYGLIILIITFSFYFTINEEGITTFADGLWYSFAVVTTIGFGDYTVVDPVSRVLSVILGLYGLVVVAVITSIIVNYYNEIKDNNNDKEEDNNNSNSEEPQEIEDESKK